MTRRKTYLTAATAVAALALTACGSSSSTSTSPTSAASGSSAAAGGGGALTKMVNIATEQPVSTLDPTNSTAYELNAEVFDFLTHLSSEGKVEAGAATTWTANSDDSVWTYKLRAGMTFSDGTPVTASDVAFSYQTIINNEKSTMHSYVTNIKTVTAPDAATVVFTMIKPDVAWPAQTATIGIVSKAAYTSEGAAKFATDPIGSGPYTVVSFDAAAAKVVLKANPKYWGGEPKTQNATIEQVTDATTRLNGLQSGQFDLALVSGGQVATAKSAGLHIQSEVSTKNIYIGFNTDAAGVSSPMLRQAISLAIDRQAIVKTLLSGFATPTGQMPTPSLNAYDPSVQAPTIDVAKAKSLVASSGYSGQTIELEYSTGYVNNASQVAQAIGSYLNAVGIKVKLVNDDVNAFLANWFSKKIGGAYLFSIQSGSPDAGSTVKLLDSTVATFTDPTITSLLAEQAVTVDPAARVKLLQQLTAQVNAQTYYVPLYTDSFNFVWNDKKISFDVPANGYLFPQYISAP